MKLYLNFERILTESELEQLRGFVQRRGKREPLQYILGTTSFCGLEIAVKPGVLIPRPETELLSERAWKFLNEHSTFNIQHSTSSQPPVALDFGTGSGCIAIALATKCPGAQIHALDFSGDALAVARENAARHNVLEKIQFHHGENFSALPKNLRFDLLVSNPPYIPNAEIETLEPELREHEPRAALDGGPDGLKFYRLLAAEAQKILNPNGKIMLELGDGQSDSVRKIFEQQNWIVAAVEADYNQRPRILIARLDESKK